MTGVTLTLVESATFLNRKIDVQLFCITVKFHFGYENSWGGGFGGISQAPPHMDLWIVYVKFVLFQFWCIQTAAIEIQRKAEQQSTEGIAGILATIEQGQGVQIGIVYVHVCMNGTHCSYMHVYVCLQSWLEKVTNCHDQAHQKVKLTFAICKQI